MGWDVTEHTMDRLHRRIPPCTSLRAGHSWRVKNNHTIENMSAPIIEARHFWPAQNVLGEGEYSGGCDGIQLRPAHDDDDAKADTLIGILWDSDANVLRWVDLKAGEIHSYVRVRGPLTGWPGGAPSGGYDMMAREGPARSYQARPGYVWVHYRQIPRDSVRHCHCTAPEQARCERRFVSRGGDPRGRGEEAECGGSSA